jgi:hypothetical protein
MQVRQGTIEKPYDMPSDGIRNLPIFEGEARSVNSVLPYLKRLIRLCLDRLHTRFVRWTRPLTPSLLSGTFADLGRSKSELMTENALLRQQLIMLKRQVKRPACTKMDRILLVLLARVVRAWKQALFLVQPDTLLSLSSGAFPSVLEAQVKGLFSQAKGSGGNYHINQRDGEGESPSSVLRGFAGNY